ncbi:MAG: phosphonate C-P lyase system protein PhnG [Brevinematales bacterium]|nr:phosphonate C-P lyase system protein PhnG [Brevinematales bacterium]
MNKTTKSYFAINFFPEDEIKKMKEKLENMEFKEKKSRTGMVMGKTIDCFDTEFYIGEVLVTECYVTYNEEEGYGIIIGDSKDRAYILACLDCLENTNNEDIFKMIDDWFNTNMHYYTEHIQNEKKIFESTKVNFGLMVEG